MNTRSRTAVGLPKLSPALHAALDAVGDVIEFWGFKRNHGRLWALLYVSGEPMSAAQIGRQLGMSKGGVSIVVRELEQWGVIHRRRVGSSAWHYFAETDFLRMIGRVLAQRERAVSQRAEQALAEALREAERSGMAREQVTRLRQMLRLARWASGAVTTFTRTAQFEASKVLHIFSREAA